MSSTVTVTEAQANLPKLLRNLPKTGHRAIQRHGKTVAFLISADLVDSLIETIELQQSPALMKTIRLHKAGKLKFKDLSCLDED